LVFRAAFSIAPRDRRLIDGYRGGILSFRAPAQVFPAVQRGLRLPDAGARQRGATGG